MARKTVAIEMDKVRNLSFGTNAMIELEERLEKPLTELDEAMGYKELRTIFYVGLKWEDKKLTVEDVGDLMDIVIGDKGIEYLSETMAKAMELAFGGNAMPTDK